MYLRKARFVPSRIAVSASTSGLWLSIPDIASTMLTMQVMPAASPSEPSIRLMAFIVIRNQSTVIGKDTQPSWKWLPRGLVR